VRKATAGLADFLKGGGQETMRRGVAIAYDSRRMSREFAQEAAQVLCGNGIVTYLYRDLRPVPMLSFAVRELGTAAGIIITASHNPKEYNGYKVYGPNGGQMEPEDADVVTAAIAAVPSLAAIAQMPLEEAEQKGLLHWLGQELDDRYFAKVRTVTIRPDVFAKVDEAFRVVYTPIHGSGSMPVQRALREAGVPGVMVVHAQEQPDSDFSTVRVPNPEEPDALAMAIELAEQHGADLCMGTDPDCDRMGLAVRRPGGPFELLTGNQIGCLLLDYILSAYKETGKLPVHGAVVKSIVSTDMADAICKAYGVDIFGVLTGFKFIAGKIEEFEETGSHQYLFGFEESFGYMAGPFVRDKDAVQACLLTAEAAAWYRLQGKTLLDVLDDLYARFGYYEEKVKTFTFAGREGMEKIAGIMDGLRRQPPEQLSDMKVRALRDYETGIRSAADGQETSLGLPPSNVLYFELEGGSRFVIRPSGTEPKIKLYFGTVDIDQRTATARLEALMDDVLQRYFQ
jgi:phosphoglucomutase